MYTHTHNYTKAFTAVFPPRDARKMDLHAERCGKLYFCVCRHRGLSQSKPEPWICMVHLYHLQERVKGSHGGATKQLLDAQVVQQNVSTVNPQHSKGTTRERGG